MVPLSINVSLSIVVLLYARYFKDIRNIYHEQLRLNERQRQRNAGACKWEAGAGGLIYLICERGTTLRSLLRKALKDAACAPAVSSASIFARSLVAILTLARSLMTSWDSWMMDMMEAASPITR
jgi:hypothetical protein